MKQLILYGAGGHCYAAIELIKSLGEFSPYIIFDDTPKETSVLRIPVKKYNSEKLQGEAICVTIGNNNNRKRIVQLFDAFYPSFVHTSVSLYPSVEIGKGTLVHPNAVLDAAAVIGNFCIINNNATVSHNVITEDYVHIAIQAAVAGGVYIGKGTLVGAGSVILPKIKVGKWVTIGAGAIVTKDIPDYAVVYGNPANIIKFNRPNER